MLAFLTFLFIVSLVMLIHHFIFESKHIKIRRNMLMVKVDILIEIIDTVGQVLIDGNPNRNIYTYNQVTTISSLSVLNGKLKEISSELEYENYHTIRSLNYIEAKTESIVKSINAIARSSYKEKDLSTLTKEYDNIASLFKDFYDPGSDMRFNNLLFNIERLWYNLKRIFKRRN